MNPKEAKIKTRLDEVLQSIFCPVGVIVAAGCHYEYYYDEGSECHVLEVWPVGFEEPEELGGNGRKKHEGDTLGNLPHDTGRYLCPTRTLHNRWSNACFQGMSSKAAEWSSLPRTLTKVRSFSIPSCYLTKHATVNSSRR